MNSAATPDGTDGTQRTARPGRGGPMRSMETPSLHKGDPDPPKITRSRKKFQTPAFGQRGVGVAVLTWTFGDRHSREVADHRSNTARERAHRRQPVGGQRDRLVRLYESRRLRSTPDP